MSILSRVRFGIFSLVLLASAVFSGSAKATILVPGSGALPPDVFIMPGATLLALNASPFTTLAGTLAGTVTSGVFSDPGNVFGAGDLDFVYQISNNASSTDSIARMTAINFAGFQTDVGYTPVGSLLGGGFVDGTVAPELVDRGASGSSIGFTFNAPITLLIGPGQTSNVLVIETNATTFTSGSANLIDGSVTTVTAFQPSAVPEPASAVLLGIGLLGLVGGRRMFRR